MKKIIFIVLFLFGTLLGNHQIFAQGPPPPPPDGHGSGENQEPGGGAPISGDLIVFFSFGAAYGAKKAYHFLRTKDE